MDGVVTEGGRTVLLLTKKTDWCDRAGSEAEKRFGARLVWHRGDLGDPLPPSLAGNHFEAIVSFVSPWIVPGWLLRAAGVALNFHPGSCDYPGIGCYNFALFEGAARYGAVCHHMLEKVDTGAVVREDLFDIRPDERVDTLKERTMETMLAMFVDLMEDLAAGRPLPTAPRGWQRKAFTRKQLNELGRVTPEMPEEEVRRRVRAMDFPGFPGAFIEIGGVRFDARSPHPA